MARHWATWLLAAAVGGCGGPAKPTPTATSAPTAKNEWQSPDTGVESRQDERPAVVEAPAGPVSSGPSDKRELAKVIDAKDAVALIRPQVNISIFQMTVPAGTVTRDEAIWKKIDESTLDVRTTDILGRNGIRVGLGNLARLEDFLRQLERGPVQSKPAIYAASGTRTIELEMRKSVQGQIVYHYDLQGQMPIRSFDDCDNIFCLEFEPAPRKPGDVRIGLCPMVRSLRTRIVAIGEVETREIQFVQPERFFDVNLRVDLPLDKFLVIGPSAEARNAMSIGGAFLTRDGGVERLEEVMIIIPQAMKAREKPAGEETNTQ